jgi:creatinine amidohydrolase
MATRTRLARTASAREEKNVNSVLLRELTWYEIQPLAGPDTVVILPTGAIEQHGRHLPIEVDSLIVSEIARRSAERASTDVPVLVAPTECFGASTYHMPFPGTLTLTMETYLTVVEELCESLIHHGFRRILILNAHGGNHDPNKIVARNVANRTGVAVASASYWNLAADELVPFQDGEVDAIPGHACGFETSMLLALRPELVRTDLMASGTSDVSKRRSDFTKRLRSEPRVHLPQQAGVVSPYGWAADPTKGSVEQGEKYLSLIVDRVARFLVEFGRGEPIAATYTYSRPTLHAVSFSDRREKVALP